MLGGRSKSKQFSKSPISPKVGKTANGIGGRAGVANGKGVPEADTGEEVQEENPPTFITVYYGNNQRAIFNTSCKSRALLEHIRRKCKCSKSVTVDLIDLEGQVKSLYKSVSRDYSRSSDVLSRGEYVLIKVEQLSQNGPTRYTSLLHNVDKIYPEINDRLHELMEDSENKYEAWRLEEVSRLKVSADAGWSRIRSSIKNSERTKDVIRAMSERKKGRSSRGSISGERRKSVDFRKSSDGKSKKRPH